MHIKMILNILVAKKHQFIRAITILVLNAKNNKISFFILLLFLFLSCKENVNNNTTQNVVAIELPNKAVEEVKNTQQLDFYNEVDNLGMGLIKPKKEKFIIYSSSVDFKKKEEESIYQPEKVTPIFYKPDYNIFYLTCDKIDGGFIVSNNGKKIYLKNENWNFINWNNFLKQSTGVNNLNWQDNPVFNNPDRKSKKVKIDINSDFVVIDFKNEWIKIQNEQKQNGWIKWKSGNDLLIEVYLLM